MWFQKKLIFSFYICTVLQIDNEKEEDDYNFVPHIYNKATKKLIKYLFKNYKGTSEQKFSNLLEFPPDKKPITKGDFRFIFRQNFKRIC